MSLRNVSANLRVSTRAPARGRSRELGGSDRVRLRALAVGPGRLPPSPLRPRATARAARKKKRRSGGVTARCARRRPPRDPKPAGDRACGLLAEGAIAPSCRLGSIVRSAPVPASRPCLPVASRFLPLPLPPSAPPLPLARGYAPSRHRRRSRSSCSRRGRPPSRSPSRFSSHCVLVPRPGSRCASPSRPAPGGRSPRRNGAAASALGHRPDQGVDQAVWPSRNRRALCGLRNFSERCATLIDASVQRAVACVPLARAREQPARRGGAGGSRECEG